MFVISRCHPSPVSDISVTRSRLPDWPTWILFVALAMVISLTAVSTVLLGLLATLVGKLAGQKVSLTSPGMTIATTALMDGAMVAGVLISARIADGRVRVQSFGFLPISGSRKRTVAITVGAWIGFLVFTLVLQAVVGQAEKQKIVDQFGAHSSDVLWLTTFVMLGVVAPFCEEFLFRGFIFSTLWRRLPLAAAALITGALFGALHLGGSAPELTIALGVFGALICLVRAATGSIIPCMAAHALNNSISYGVSEHVPALGVLAMAAISIGVVTAISSMVSAKAYTRRDGDQSPSPGTDLRHRGGAGGELGAGQ
jgi:membrane protease YdiL (CAAX protease family)